MGAGGPSKTEGPSLLSPKLVPGMVAPAAALGANPDPVLPGDPFREAGVYPAAPPGWGDMSRGVVEDTGPRRVSLWP